MAPAGLFRRFAPPGGARRRPGGGARWLRPGPRWPRWPRWWGAGWPQLAFSALSHPQVARGGAGVGGTSSLHVGRKRGENATRWYQVVPAGPSPPSATLSRRVASPPSKPPGPPSASLKQGLAEWRSPTWRHPRHPQPGWPQGAPPRSRWRGPSQSGPYLQSPAQIAIANPSQICRAN